VRGREGAALRGELVFVKVSSLDWIAAQGNYVSLHAGSESYLHRESLQNIAAELDPVFLRVHRSAIVNIERVRKLAPAADGSASIVLQNGTTIPLGPTYRAALEEALGLPSS
jgi:two-component system LytT family response regulator